MAKGNSQKRPGAGDKQELATRENNAKSNQAPIEGAMFNILSAQCCIIGAEKAAILQPFADEKILVRTAFPRVEAQQEPPTWLKYAIQFCYEAISVQIPTIKPVRKADDLYGQPSREYLLMSPFSL